MSAAVKGMLAFSMLARTSSGHQHRGCVTSVLAGGRALNQSLSEIQLTMYSNANYNNHTHVILDMIVLEVNLAREHKHL